MRSASSRRCQPKAGCRERRAVAPLVSTYGTVPYADIDPTWLAWASYVLMFGMMFGDAGHGLLLIAAALCLRAGWPGWARGLRGAWLFVGGAGLAATAFGVAYGEFFGPTGLVPALWLEPPPGWSSAEAHCGSRSGPAGSAGYITEGQIVLDPDLYARGIYPLVDALSSLSRLMRHGAGPGRTRADHLDVAAQTLAALAAARRARELAELIGSAALSESDRRYQALERAFQENLVNQGSQEARSLAETLRLAWQVLAVLPRRELSMLPAEALDTYYPRQ
jgi:hypothetical protein